MNRMLAILLLILAHFHCLPPDASAAPITVPTGLNPGDQYRLVFVTSALHNGLSSDIGVYNAFVTGVANAVPELAALTTTWSAIASTAAVDARDNTGTNPTLDAGVPIYRLDDVMVATSNATFWQTSHLATMGILETGAIAGIPNEVWTGTDYTGIELVTGGLGTGASVKRPGNHTMSGAGTWARSLSVSSYGFEYRFYAMSDVLVVPGVPEPSTLALAGFGLVGLGAYGWSRRRLAA